MKINRVAFILMSICLLTGCQNNNKALVCENKVQSVDYTSDSTLIINMSAAVLDNECIMYSLNIPVDFENNEFSFYKIVNETTGVVREDKNYVVYQYGTQPKITGTLTAFDPDNTIENQLNVFIHYMVNGEQEASDLISVDFSDVNNVKAELVEHLNK